GQIADGIFDHVRGASVLKDDERVCARPVVPCIRHGAIVRKLPALALRFIDDMWLLLSAGFLCLMG
ncbi:hypothetical protein, partial [Mesorhizobium sp.]|uniref:hypothetical protein n=1 Tax=Mesorhizobium sp. TaxID=1871066 RepID=UPI00257C4BEF